MKTTSKSYSVAVAALVIVLVMFLGLFSSVSNDSVLQLIRSLRFSQGTRTEQAPHDMTSAAITCDRSHTNYDVCSINGSCNLDTKTGTFTLMDPTFATSAPFVEKIRPYARKGDEWVMSMIKELTLTSGPLDLTLLRSCDITHDSPAVVFSAGGYTGSIYHDFIDCFIPLFITANSYFPDRDFILVVVDPKEWWMPKYVDLLGAFSKHKTILLLDKENASSITHCFPSAVVGLISHGHMRVNPSQIPNSKSLVDFHNLLDKAFKTNISTLKTNKPRLIFVSRYGNVSRVILNEKEVKEMLEDVGFEVITFRPSKKTSLREAYKLIKSSHAMVGVHGAALTHFLFLRPGLVFVQVVPVGLDWAANTCFEKPAKAMKLEYIEYSVNVGESSLVEKYSRDDLVLRDPIAFRGLGWNVTRMNVYLKEQDVRLNVNRFTKRMNKAYEKAKSFMDIDR
ncbi:unnamed protein product [Microthlaspi erraticum]|uniref:Glycosyltransferase 61 catalytic domain-containing protein n=1 Tax=Microthlaspi erraticum TaxID=1685480 RepID=A0A6D2JU92_9BRAS|nr:unnamed protein product [Microthlaspi erraticum]